MELVVRDAAAAVTVELESVAAALAATVTLLHKLGARVAVTVSSWGNSTSVALPVLRGEVGDKTSSGTDTEEGDEMASSRGEADSSVESLGHSLRLLPCTEGDVGA